MSNFLDFGGVFWSFLSFKGHFDGILTILKVLGVFLSTHLIGLPFNEGQEVEFVENFYVIDFNFVALFEGFYNELLRLMSIGVG